MKAFLLSVLALALLAPAGFGAVIDCTTAPVTISTNSLGSGGTNVCAGLNGETFSGFTLASGFGVGIVPTVDNTNTQVQILVSGPTTYVVFTPVTPGGWNISGVSQYTINATYTYNTNQANFYIAFFNGSATGAGSVSLTKALGSPAGTNGAVNVSTGGNGQPCASPIGGFTCSPLSSVTPGPFTGALLITDNFQLNASGSSASASAFGDAFGVPEPATLGSMGLGLLLVGFLARRKRA